ncbi:MAG: hypothetical protein ACYS0K_14755 [Planctomycetota bacterium]|jgi:predicted  nucleic acid-binding Zn-ribbon protein
MPIKVVCSCGAKFAAREELAGKPVECTACGKRVHVPHAVAAGAGSAGSGALKAGMVVLGVAVAACGYMVYTQQQSLADLQQELSTEHARVDDVRKEIEANKTADEEVAEEVEKEKKRLTEEAKKQESLLASLDKLDMESVRIRGDIARVEEERRKLMAETESKRAAYDRRLEELQADLRTKTGAEETAKINDEIKTIQDPKRELAREAEANRTKIAAYDGELKGFQDQLRAKIVEQEKLSDQVTATEDKLAALEKRANPDTLKQYIRTLWSKAYKNRPAVFQTLAAEDRRWKLQAWFRMDTRTGRVFYRYHRTRSVIGDAPGPSFMGVGPAGRGQPGRFEMHLGLDSAGDLGELIRLDTKTGDVWYVPLNRTSNLWWRRIPVMQPGFMRQTKLNPKWTVTLDRLRSGSVNRSRALLVVTAPNGMVYDDARAHRTWLLPNP